jgi:hypothetical protein
MQWDVGITEYGVSGLEAITSLFQHPVTIERKNI